MLLSVIPKIRSSNYININLDYNYFITNTGSAGSAVSVGNGVIISEVEIVNSNVTKIDISNFEDCISVLIMLFRRTRSYSRKEMVVLFRYN
mgnify:CR=1 FL=1